MQANSASGAQLLDLLLLKHAREVRRAQVYRVSVCNLYLLHDINFSWKKYEKDSGYHVEEEFIAIIN